MAIPGRLETEQFSYETGWTQTKQAAIDIEGRQVVLKDPPKTTLPKGGYIEINQIIEAAYGQATNEDKAAQIAAALLGATDGIRELVEKDESIGTSDEAQQRATGKVAEVSKDQIGCRFQTDQYGFEPGQIQEIIDADMSIDVMLFLGNLAFDIQNAVGGAAKIKYTVQLGAFPNVTPGALIRRALARGPGERAPITFETYVDPP